MAPARRGLRWVLLAAAARACAALSDCPSTDLVRYDEFPGKFISCVPPAHQELGDRVQQEKLCTELGDDCSGVTCSTANGVSCSVRHHHACEGGKFLADSPTGEVSYVKNCTNCRWEAFQGYYIPCYAQDDKDVGALLERQVECHEMGADCIGVTCDKQGCTARHHKACESGGDKMLVASPSETSYIKTCGLPGQQLTPIPVADAVAMTFAPPPPNQSKGCDWFTHADMEITCFVQGDDQGVGSLDLKKQQCEKLGEACAGLTCSAPESGCALRHHQHCADEGAHFMKSAPGKFSYVKSCEGKSICGHACWVHDESGNSPPHSCSTSCDCTGARECSVNGWCTGPTGMCLRGTDCSWSRLDNHYICGAAVDTTVSSLDAARDKCTKLGEQCSGVTCNKDNQHCDMRNHQQCADGRYLEVSNGEFSFQKSCGPNRFSVMHHRHHRPGTFFLMCIIALLLVVIGVLCVLVYRNRTIADRFGRGVGFAQLAQVADEEDAEEVASQ
eukprot:TRINITY_DN65714_c0_g1_i1.p1 TRINITY_DN65714_c0_g1~~TRINITY_DN65714_c0_g1_i1.p1  ORF type:complete len:528 (+),score=171.43 TRINITY_DN65714_c0_g1_i1:79-1584(+)